LPIHPKGRLLALGGAFLLFAQHDVYLFGLDILPHMPCRKTIFVLFFSDCVRIYTVAGPPSSKTEQRKEKHLRGKEFVIALHDAFDIAQFQLVIAVELLNGLAILMPVVRSAGTKDIRRGRKGLHRV
jgi:hypothetical protein